MIEEIIFKRIDTDKVEKIIQKKQTYSIKEKKDKIKNLELQRNSISFIEIPLIEKNKKLEPIDNQEILTLIDTENFNREMIIADIENQIKMEQEELNIIEKIK